MSYVINSRLLDIDYRKQHIQSMLKSYLRGEDISKSEVWVWAHRTIKRGWWWYGCETLKGEALEQCIRNRQQIIVDLYKNIKTKGYDGSTISVYFDKTSGQVHTYDGFHRLSIIEFLGRNYDMNCVVSHHHPDPNQRGDFPLAERLKELNGNQEYLYQPCEDNRVKNWPVWRPDSEARLNAFSTHLVEGSVLDAGCGSGWFSRQLAKKGFQVTSLDSNELRVGVARYLSITQNLRVKHCCAKWQTFLTGKTFSNILLLSTLHHDFLGGNTINVWRNLEALSDKCKRLVVECPLTSRSVAWIKEEQRDMWNYSLEEFTQKLMDATNMKVNRVVSVHPARPIIVLET